MRTTSTLAPGVETYRRRFREAGNRRQLDELATQIARELRQMDDAAASDDGAGGGMSEESKALFDALLQLLTEINEKVERQHRFDDATQRSQRSLDRADTRFEASRYQFELRGMILAQIGRPIAGIDLGRSREISEELRRSTNRSFTGTPVPIEALSLRASYARGLERRADTISTGLPAAGPGSNVVPTYLLSDQYVDALRARSVIRQAGATVLSNLSGNIDIPGLSKTAQVSSFSEGSSIARPAPEEFRRISLRVKHCGAIISYSIDMLLNSSPSVEMLIRDDLSRLLALDIDRVALVGSGQGAEPLGVIRTPGVTQIPATDFAYLNNVELRRQLSSKNVPIESIAFVGNSQIDAWSLSALDAMSRPLGKQLVYLGYPDYTSNVCTAPAVTGPPALAASANPLIAMAASDLLLGFWRELDLRASDQVQTAWDTGGVEVRAIMDADVSLRHVESFAWADVQTGPALPPLVAAAGAPLASAGAARTPAR